MPVSLHPIEPCEPKYITVNGPYDAVVDSLRPISHNLAPGHPLESTLRNYEKTEEGRQSIMASRLFGGHMVFQLESERCLSKAASRLPVLPSSRLLEEVLAGADETLEASDFLNSNYFIYYLADICLVPMHSTTLMDPHTLLDQLL